MTLRSLANTTGNGLQILCVVVVAIVVVRHEFFAPKPPSTTTSVNLSKGQWATAIQRGHRFGSAQAPVTIVEFADFECPACRQFEGLLQSARKKYPTEVSILFRHWPLSYHHQAYPAARAAECAGAQGRFEQFHDAIYAENDLLGQKPYAQFAREAGVPDVEAFAKCASLTDSVPAIEADVREAHALNGTGTPLLIINGTQITNGGADSTVLDGLIRDALRRKATK